MLVKKKKNRLSPRDRRLLITEIRALIGKNYNDYEIMEEMNLQPHVLADLKKEILAIDGAVFNNMSSVAVYADFVEKSKNNIKTIDGFFTKFKNRGQWSALVGGIKVKQEIYKDVIKLGQELGFIEKKSGELKLTGEVQFSTTTEAEVMKEIQSEVSKIKKMISKDTVQMRPEIVDVVGDEVKKFLPAPKGEVIEAEVVPAKPSKKKVLTKVKVQLKKRV